MTEQKPQQIALKHFPECRIPEPSSLPLTGTIRAWSVGDDMNEANRAACKNAISEATSSLEAELAQVKAERDQIAEEVKHNVLNWGRVEANERLCRDLAAGLRILQIIIRASGGGLVGYNGRTAHEWAREFDALLSRPEVVKLLEKEKV